MEKDRNLVRRTRVLGRAAMILQRKAEKRKTRKRKAVLSLVGVLLVVASLLSQVLGPLVVSPKYDLSPEVLNLVGSVRDDASEHLKQNYEQGTIDFAVPESEKSGGEHTGRVEDAYSASFSVDPKKGISITDTATKISMRMTPKFHTLEGKQAPDNQIIYPFGKNQLVYTLLYSGVKEDIIVPEFLEDNLDYTFELSLPISAEARLGDDGTISIYTADVSFLGEISYSSDEDRELVEKARQSGEKTNLIATIPAPIIKDATNKEYTDRSKFVLGDKKQITQEVSSNTPAELKDKLQADSTFNTYELTISSTKLHELSYPISIDPTFQITSAADFSGLDLSAGVDIDSSSSLIRRAPLTGGTLEAWGTTTNLPAVEHGHASTAYNGYLYIIGGAASGGMDASLYAKFNSNGTLASDAGCGTTWCTTTSIHSALWYSDVAAYNGYMYVAGGRDPTAAITTVEYAPINADGTLGAWTATASLPTARQRHPIAVYNGYLYVIGGQTTGGGNVSSVDYALLNADGSIAADSGCAASWCSGTALPRNSSQQYVGVYNGVIYSAGGLAGASNTTEVLMSRIGSNGAPGSWSTTSALNTARNDFSAGELIIYGGYAYAISGCDVAGCATKTTTVEYAPINADGTLGAWDYTDSITTGRSHTSRVFWDGYLYTIGGCTSGSCSGNVDTIEYTSIKSAGSLDDDAWSTTTSFTTSRRWHNAHVYNGFLYVIGGRDTGGTMLNTIQYAAISDTGTVGSWTTSGNTFTAGLRNFASEIYGGYMYISGGMTTDVGSSDIDTVEYAPINADGTVGTWATTTSLSLETAWHDMFAWNGYLYTVGGAGFTNIEYAAINSSNGTIGSWSSAGALPNEMLDATVLLHGGYIYLVGGCNGNSCPGFGGNQALYQTTIDYAPVNSNGTIGSWTATSSFTDGRSAKQALIYNGYLYLLGGYDFTDNTAYDDVQLAPINSDGSLGSFTYSEVLPNTYLSFGAVAWAGNMYIVGGESGAGTTNEVSYQAINNGGRGSPATFGGSLSGSARKNHASVVYNGYLYILGGCTTATTCTTATNTVRYAPINTNGTLGTWGDVTTPFTTARRDLHAWVLSGRLYVAGGRDAGGTFQTDIQYVTIQSDGNINTSWTTDGTSFPSNGYAPGVALNNNVLYVLGGSNSGGDDTWYAVVDEDTGDVGTFTSTTVIPEGRQRGWAVINRGYIYIMGGYNSGSSSYLRSVWYAPLNSNNTIGTWRMASTELNNAMGALSSTSAFAHNGYMYIAGGGAATPHGYIDHAAISANGDLGIWQRSVTTGLASHADFAAVEYNGRIYATGGQYASFNPTQSVRYASLQSTPRIGSFSKKYDFEEGVRPENLVTRGLMQTDGILSNTYSSNVSCDNTVYANTLTTAGIRLGGTNALSIEIGNSNTLIRCLTAAYTINDVYSAIFPDTGNESYVSDFDLYFISNPGSRLRGGRTFTNGVDRGFDANPEVFGGNLLTSNYNDSNLSSYVTASVSPKEDRVLLLAVDNAISSDLNPPTPSSISGYGLTWDLVETALETSSGVTGRRTSVYRAQTGSSPPTPGAVTINFGSTQHTVEWALLEFFGVALGNNGADAIGFIDTDTTTGTTLSLDLGVEVARSLTVVFASSNVNSVPLSGTGTELSSFVNGISPTIHQNVRYSSTGVRLWSITDGGSTRKLAIGIRMLPNVD